MTWQKRHPPNFTKMLSIKNSTILHIWSAVYRLSPPGLMVSMKYPFPLVILMWVYLLLPFLLLNELCISAVIRDLSRLCGIDMYKMEKSYVWTDVAVRTSSWSRDENRLVDMTQDYSLWLYKGNFPWKTKNNRSTSIWVLLVYQLWWHMSKNILNWSDPRGEMMDMTQDYSLWLF